MTNENYREKIVGKELKELCIAVINKLQGVSHQESHALEGNFYMIIFWSKQIPKRKN